MVAEVDLLTLCKSCNILPLKVLNGDVTAGLAAPGVSTLICITADSLDAGSVSFVSDVQSVLFSKLSMLLGILERGAPIWRFQLAANGSAFK